MNNDIKVSEPVVAEKSADSNPTESDAEVMADSLLGEQAEESSQPSEAESTEEKPAEESKTDADESGKKVEVDAIDYLKIKRQAGRVEHLQKSQSELSKQLKQYREELAVKLPKEEEEKELTADETVNKLTGDNPEKFLRDVAKKSVASEMDEIKARLASAEKDAAAARRQAAASEYDQQLEEICGDEYTDLRPFMNDLVAAVREGVGAGDENALQEEAMIQASPKYLSMLAKEYRATKISQRNEKARKARDTERFKAQDISGSGGGAKEGVDEDGLSSAQVESGIQALMGY